MKGFFKFDLKANDGKHESGVKVKIVIISVDNKISITFVNSMSDVQKYERKLGKIPAQVHTVGEKYAYLFHFLIHRIYGSFTLAHSKTPKSKLL